MIRDEKKLIGQLIRHEGLRLRPYNCPAGKLTIGVGRNLDDVGITKGEAIVLLANDVTRADHDLRNIFTIYRVDIRTVNGPRYEALINVCFNIGVGSLKKFKRMFRAIRAENWIAASIELLDSKYADDVGRRAVELSNQLRTGEYQDVENC